MEDKFKGMKEGSIERSEEDDRINTIQSENQYLKSEVDKLKRELEEIRRKSIEPSAKPTSDFKNYENSYSGSGSKSSYRQFRLSDSRYPDPNQRQRYQYKSSQNEYEYITPSRNHNLGSNSMNQPQPSWMSLRYNPNKQKYSEKYYSKPSSTSLSRTTMHKHNQDLYNERPNYASYGAPTSAYCNQHSYHNLRARQANYEVTRSTPDFIGRAYGHRHTKVPSIDDPLLCKEDRDNSITSRINALKECIKEIESKQEEILSKIDSRINTKYEYEREETQEDDRDKDQGDWSHFDKVYNQSLAKSKEIHDKYIDPKYEYSTKESPERPENHRVMPLRTKTDVYVQDKPAVTYPRRSKFQHKSSNYLNTFLKPQQPKPDPEPIKEEKQSLKEPENVVHNTSTAPLNKKNDRLAQSDEKLETSLDKTDLKILQRNKNMQKSLEDLSRDSRSSPRALSRSTSRRKVAQRNFFTVEDNKDSSDKYELVDDSFGSPQPKRGKAKQGARNQGSVESRITYKIEDFPCFNCENNDHIIQNLEAQNAKFEEFLPRSRVEPVPTTMDANELAITYQSSPDKISYQYEEADSPPKCGRARNELYHSPSSKRQRKEDFFGDYNCNPDNMSAMRATDLHCGRGSSPLRTKIKKSPRLSRANSRSPRLTKSKSKSKSPSKGYNSTVKTFRFSEPLSSQRSQGMSSIKTPTPSKFQRRCKVSNPASTEKLEKEELIHRERKHRLLAECKQVVQSQTSNFQRSSQRDDTNRRSRDLRNKSKTDSRAGDRVISSVRGRSKAGSGLAKSVARQDSASKPSKIDMNVNAVQKRKEEIFQKRQEELKAKLEVKEAKRQMLANSNWSYTPKRLDESPVKNLGYATQESFQ